VKTSYKEFKIGCLITKIKKKITVIKKVGLLINPVVAIKTDTVIG
jgi:hypothetical protein